MRCFVGIPLPEETRRALVDAGSAVRRVHTGWRGEKWVAAENLHITVAFLGEVSSDTVEQLVPAITDELEGLTAFNLPLGLLRPVPNARRTRLLWAQYDDPDGRCEALAVRIAHACAPFDIELEERPFRAHVTLARARRPRRFPEQTAHVLDAAADAIPGFVSVHSATLYASTLTKAGPRYDTLNSWQFAT